MMVRFVLTMSFRVPGNLLRILAISIVEEGIHLCIHALRRELQYYLFFFVFAISFVLFIVFFPITIIIFPFFFFQCITLAI